MIIEISVAVISLAFLLLVIFLVKTLLTTNATLKQTKTAISHMQKEVVDLSHESQKLLRTVNSLTSDIKEKTDSLDFIFRPLSQMSHPHREKKTHHDPAEKVEDIVEWIVSGISLYKKLKGR